MIAITAQLVINDQYCGAREGCVATLIVAIDFSNANFTDQIDKGILSLLYEVNVK